MKIALYGKPFRFDFRENMRSLVYKLEEKDAELIVYSEFADFLTKEGGIKIKDFEVFDEKTGIPNNTDFLFSLGGDGTFLETLHYIKKSGTPVLGLNAGRLGFLANISRNEMNDAIDELYAGNFSLEDRSLLSLQNTGSPLAKYNTALNEITVHKSNIAMITIMAELDGEFLNSYWADGLIISTPTGSTAYSMSVGGPIMIPESQSFIISPVSPHNLTVRPIVIPDNKIIKLSIKARSDKYLVAIDSKSYEADTDIELSISKADYCLKMVKFPANNFYNTLRNKLMWGMDRRN
jgi:NAD+ kinase